MRKILLYILLSLSVFSLSGQTDTLIGFIAMNELEELFNPETVSTLINGPDSAWTYSLSPWPDDQDTAAFQPYTGLTHLFISLDGFGPEESFTQSQLLMLERLSSLWKGKIYINMIITEEEMEKDNAFSESIGDSLLELHNNRLIDGVNWELALSQDREDYPFLMVLSGLLFSENIPQSYTLGRSEKTVDFLADKCSLFIIKAFDFSGRHSTYENAEESTENFIIRRDCDPAELVLALPAYGRKFHSSDPDYWVKTRSYKEIVMSYEPKADVNEVESFYFNGVDMAEKKTGLAIEKGLAGLALYPLSWDGQGSFSLLQTIDNSLKQK